MMGVIKKSVSLAREQGWDMVRSPHLFAAIIDSWPHSLAFAMNQIQMNSENLQQLKKAILSVVPPQTGAISETLPTMLSPQIEQVLKKAYRLALRQGRHKVGNADLIQTFMADDAGVVPLVLRQSGFKK